MSAKHTFNLEYLLWGKSLSEDLSLKHKQSIERRCLFMRNTFISDVIRFKTHHLFARLNE